ncbi:hypothetical protein LZK98_02430 [Sphingomonas cannabina]|uniref:hypothetical protein n=1 Tax=Sphingomonas cannabina TaxID=2899123 RepID=UPI001F37A952|nr:hypothetical protein [Sphingomonas cannabina]UIJ45836.1 hypothetical protein LZK98_02430 [Sphingomonas cannabina]
MSESDAPDVTYADAPTVLLIADDTRAGGAAERAVALAGARLLDRVRIADAAERLAMQPALDILMVELTGITADVADDVLGHVEAAMRERELRVIVAFGEDQIDLVAARLMGPGIKLLCAPGVGDRVAALATMPQGPATQINEPRRDEAEQLRMLNAEVARIAETLARLTRGEDDEPGSRIRPTLHEPARGYGMPPVIETGVTVSAAEVRGAIRARRLRANFFAADLFADPAWDMLLDLFAAELEHVRVSVSSLCIAAAVPGTTALRWIGTMIDAGLFERHADPFDRRRAYVSLSEKAREGMLRYFAAIRRAGLASA